MVRFMQQLSGRVFRRVCASGEGYDNIYTHCIYAIILLLRWLIEPFLVLLGGTAALLRRTISRPSNSM